MHLYFPASSSRTSFICSRPSDVTLVLSLGKDAFIFVQVTFAVGFPETEQKKNRSVGFVDSQRSWRNCHFWCRNRFSGFTFNPWDTGWSDISFNSFFSSNPRWSHNSLFSIFTRRSHNSLGTFSTSPPFVAFVALGSSSPLRSRSSTWTDVEVSTLLANL